MTTRRGFLGALAAVAVVPPAVAPTPRSLPVPRAGITDGGTGVALIARKLGPYHVVPIPGWQGPVGPPVECDVHKWFLEHSKEPV